MAAQNGNTGLMEPDECVLLLIDHQPQMTFAVRSHEVVLLMEQTVALAKAARLFEVPCVLTTVAAKTFSGDLWPELQALFPEQGPIDRTNMNAWEDAGVRAAVERTGRRKVVLAGLWTEVCAAFPTLDMLREGYEVRIVTDACGDISAEAHERAVQRAIQAGAIPMTALQVLFEWQRDWGRMETYAGAIEILVDHSAYGVGVRYAKSILGEQASDAGALPAIEIARQAL